MFSLQILKLSPFMSTGKKCYYYDNSWIMSFIRGFQVHSFLPYYYAIKGKRKDGYTHVLYLNGGHPTWGLLDYVKLAGVTLCSISPHRYNNTITWHFTKYDMIYQSYFQTGCEIVQQIEHSLVRSSAKIEKDCTQ